MECPQISVLRQRRMVLYFLKYLKFLDETFGECKLYIEDANYAIKKSEGVGRALRLDPHLRL